MSQKYHAASQVVVRLGNASADSDLAFGHLNEDLKNVHRLPGHNVHLNEGIVSGCSKSFSSSTGPGSGSDHPGNTLQLIVVDHLWHLIHTIITVYKDDKADE